MRAWIKQPDGSYKVVVAMGLINIGTPNMRIVTKEGVDSCTNIEMVFD